MSYGVHDETAGIWYICDDMKQVTTAVQVLSSKADLAHSLDVPHTGSFRVMRVHSMAVWIENKRKDRANVQCWSPASRHNFWVTPLPLA